MVFLRADETLPSGGALGVTSDRTRVENLTTISTLVTGEVWNVMAGRQGSSLAPGRLSSAEPFRLAGTFSIETGDGKPIRKAILDNLIGRKQYIVGEGEIMDDVTVTKIHLDHVTLQGGGGTRDIWLEFASRSPVAGGASNQVVTAAVAGSTNRFGCIQINDSRWQFSRKPLLDYYQELLDEPDRMVAIFDTMKPVRDARNKITGYVVGLEGEREFFDAVGLKQGDIVRAVNSIPMTNRKRAEFLIDEFLKDNMSAVVLEVDRGGQGVKQVYQLRQ